jgi:HTH-type transcriptional regulator, sugar sensing transcriptional regulator
MQVLMYICHIFVTQWLTFIFVSSILAGSITPPLSVTLPFMYEQALIDAGFSRHQAAVYSFLIANGPRQASAIARETRISRTLVYRVLEELDALGLVEKTDKKGAVSTFAPGHPIKLHDMVEARKKSAELAAASIDSVVDNLTSEYNKTIGKPGVRFFEGPTGVEYVLEDSLRAKGMIYTYADIEAVMEHIGDINTRYATKREKLGKKKKVILLDSPKAREIMGRYHRTVTDTKFISLESPPFGSVMEIYDDTISYVTLSEDRMIGVIIEDGSIASMHKYLFEYLWGAIPDVLSGA